MSEYKHEQHDYEGVIDGGGYKAVMDSPKIPIELMDPTFIEGISEVLLHGAKKYAKHNWMRGMSWTTVYGGIQRHLNAFYRGEEFDSDTDLAHLYHAGCGLMFLSHYAHVRRDRYAEMDDRVFTLPPEEEEATTGNLPPDFWVD